MSTLAISCTRYACWLEYQACSAPARMLTFVRHVNDLRPQATLMGDGRDAETEAEAEER
jgi:hypothetical protein